MIIDNTSAGFSSYTHLDGTVQGCVPYEPFPHGNFYYPKSSQVVKRKITTTKTYDDKGRVTGETVVEEIEYGPDYYVTNNTEFPRLLSSQVYRQDSNTGTVVAETPTGHN